MSIQSKSSPDGQALTITIKGRFDFSCLSQFQNAYSNVTETPKAYVIDLKETDYLDSSALGMLLELRDKAGGDTADVSIVNCNMDVKKILMITKLDEYFKVEG